VLSLSPSCASAKPFEMINLVSLAGNTKMIKEVGIWIEKREIERIEGYFT
jgi:hypothetical protein